MCCSGLSIRQCLADSDLALAGALPRKSCGFRSCPCEIVHPLDTPRAMAGKDVGLRIRVERTLRGQFLKACQARHIPAAQVLRAFMRDFASTHEEQLDAATAERSSGRSPSMDSRSGSRRFAE
jgi:hypothetical protein